MSYYNGILDFDKEALLALERSLMKSSESINARLSALQEKLISSGKYIYREELSYYHFFAAGKFPVPTKENSFYNVDDWYNHQVEEVSLFVEQQILREMIPHLIKEATLGELQKNFESVEICQEYTDYELGQTEKLVSFSKRFENIQIGSTKYEELLYIFSFIATLNKDNRITKILVIC